MEHLKSSRVYTPQQLASAMVRALGNQPTALWLEPSHGKGSFVEAISRVGVDKKRIFAIDVDPRESPADKLAITVRGIDFLEWANETDQRFDRVVGNPPFISIKRLPQRLKRVAASIVDFSGRPVGEGANLWYSFVLTSIRLLKVGGSLAFVLPSAAEYANYSAAIRVAVRNRFRSLELYRCERPLFENVQEGALVAVARGYGEHPFTMWRKSFRTREALIQGLSRSGYRNGHRCPSGRIQAKVATINMKEIAKIQLGGVTGDASYFLMTERKREAYQLPETSLTPVVSKARHLQAAFIDAEKWTELRLAGERIWLFNPRVTAVKLPEVKEYLELERGKGGCNVDAYKVSVREPWYRTPLPNAPHAFLSGMSQHGPWVSINEMDGLNATNTLYVVTFRMENRNSWYMWALAFLSSIAQRQIRRLGRKYADGLIKYEPGSLSRIKLPVMKPQNDYRTEYIRAVSALLSGNRTMATFIADSAVLPSSA